MFFYIIGISYVPIMKITFTLTGNAEKKARLFQNWCNTITDAF